MKQIYLIDTENVGNLWMDLLVHLKDDAEIKVFYTTNSPHISYEHLFLFKELDTSNITFYNCFVGNNALDFQLVSELGFMLANQPVNEYFIISNDKGYDAVVNYWKTRGMHILRLTEKNCSSIWKQEENDDKGNDKIVESIKRDEALVPVYTFPVLDVFSNLIHSLSFKPDSNLPDILKKVWSMQMTLDLDKGIALELLYCVGRHQMDKWKLAMNIIFETDKAKALMKDINQWSSLSLYMSSHCSLTKAEKFELYCTIVFYMNHTMDMYSKNFIQYFYSIADKRKNLYALHSALQKKYGLEDGGFLYHQFKEHIKIINHIK